METKNSYYRRSYGVFTVKMSSIVLLLLTVSMAPTSFAVTNCLLNPKADECKQNAPSTCFDEIQALKCWGDQDKCNIKFKNTTGLGSGSGGGTGYNQKAEASTVHISARKADEDKAGSNTLTISAGASNTLNLDKKKSFDHIRVIRKDGWGFRKADIGCVDVKRILNGNGFCKVFVGSLDMKSANSTVVTCNSAKVVVTPG
jgi:hypothetical protein